ncbi:TOBE domain-containing protein [Nocardia sp. bgisy118]|uniref:TOBE domain-containing protein n=1 Tax=Nocardia sp. bgisy118 TaxID=3413786 RepID=UPI003F49E965
MLIRLWPIVRAPPCCRARSRGYRCSASGRSPRCCPVGGWPGSGRRRRGRPRYLRLGGPNAVSLHQDQPTGSQRNSWPVIVTGLEQRAHTTRVRLDGSPPILADFTPATVAELRIQPGARLWASLEAAEIHTYPA